MQYTQQAATVTAEVNKAVQGKQQTVNTIWMAMLAGGHVLNAAIPGVRKTTQEMAFARDASTHVVYMADGVICEEGTPADIFERPQNPKTVEFLSRFRQA